MKRKINDVAIMCNSVATTPTKLGLGAERLMLTTLCKFDYGAKKPKRGVRFSFKEFQEISGAKDMNTKQRKAAAEELSKLRFVQGAVDNRAGVPFVSITPFPGVYYGDGEFLISINEAVIPWIHALDTNYAGILLKHAKNMTSATSIKLFKALSQYQHLKHRKDVYYDIADLIDLLSNKDCPNVSLFVNKNLSDAVKLINSEGYLHVEYSVVKEGRSIAGIDFSVSKAKKQKQSNKLLDS